MYLLLRQSDLFSSGCGQYRFKIDILSRTQLFCVFVVFCLCFAGLLALQTEAVPWRYSRQTKFWFGSDVKDILSNHHRFNHEVTSLSPWNQEFLFELSVFRKPESSEKHFGLELPLQLQVQVTNQRSSLTEIRDLSVVLLCTTASLNRTVCPDKILKKRSKKDLPSSLCGACERISLVHDTFINSPTYKVTLQFLGTKGEIAHLLDDVVALQTEFVYPSESFTLFSCYFHYGFACTGLLVTIIFWFSHWYHLSWTLWPVEAKVVFGLLLMLSLLNNPLLFLNIYTPYWFFPRLNSLFLNTYFTLFMLFVLVLAHFFQTKPPTAALMARKLIFVALFWLIGFLAVWNTRSRHIIENDVGILRLFFLVFVSAYVGWLVQAMLSIAYQLGQGSASSKPNQLLLLLLLLLPAIIAGHFFLILQNTTRHHMRVGFFTLYNMFTLLLSWLYLPVRTIPAIIS